MKFLILLSVLFIQSLYSEAKKNVPIEILISSDNRIYEQGLYGIQSIIGTDVKVSYLDIVIAENPEIANYFKKIEDDNPPFIITIGPSATKTAREHLKNTPVLFSMINAPKSLGLSQGKLCGVSMDISVTEFFTTLKDINKEIRNVYSFYSTSEGEYAAGEGEYSDLQYKIIYNKIKITDKKDFSKELNALAGKAEAFLMVNDPLYGKNEFEELSNFCKKNKIILMTSFPALVKAGATFGISPDYSKIGVLTGQMAERILLKTGGANCESELVKLPDQSSFYLNDEYAKESGITVPETILERAKLTRLFGLGVNLINEGKYNSAKTVFESILKKDKENKSASSFYQLVLEKLSGSKVRDLLASAEAHMKNKRFANARSDYQRILSINPNILEAKMGVQNSLQLQSENERMTGQSHARSGKPFEAVRMFQTALKTLPTNAAATNDLNALRSAESHNMPEYVKKGVKLYNEREYEKAIEVFDNALLIVPNNKEAIEYLRLSKKKKDALITLKGKLDKDK